MINVLKKKLNETIEKYGIKSKEAYNASIEVDDEVARFYQTTQMGYFYHASIKALNQYVEQNGTRPTLAQWNYLAKTDGYLSSESLKYMGNIKLK